MNAESLKSSILQLAIQGKLVEQREEEGTAEDLLNEIRIKKQKLIKKMKIRGQNNIESIELEETYFDIPSDWKWVRLSDLGVIVGGGTPKTSIKENWDKGNISWLTPADMKDKQGKYISKGSRMITELGLTSSSAKLMPKGTIVFSSRAPIGYIAIAENELSTNQGFKSLVPGSEEINLYLYYCLIARTKAIQSRGTGTTFKEISGKEFGKTVIPLPPLAEQKRIVEKIEELMPLVERYGKAYEEVTELNKNFPVEMEKSILQYAIQGKLAEQREEEGTAEDLYKQIQLEKEKLIEEGKIRKQKKLPEVTEEEIPFDIPETWKWVRLSDLTENIHYGYTASAQDNGNAKLLRITDIQDNKVEWMSVPHCDISEENFSKYSLNNRDILIARTGGTIGKTYIVNSLHEKSVFASYLIRAIPLKGINEVFLKNFMESPFYWSQLRKGSMGTGQPNVNATTLSKLLLPLPPLSEQKRIVARIEELLEYTRKLKEE